jgi:hypothetical protein
LRLENYRLKFSKDNNKAMAELLTRNAVLETEMQHYKVYMATTAARNKREKKRMSKVIQELMK